MRRLFQRLRAFLNSNDVQSLFVLVAIGLATIAIIYTYHNNRRVEIEFGDNVAREDVEFILERANDATQVADTILSWLEGASVIIGVLIVVGGWMFRNSVQNQIEESRARLQESIENYNRFIEKTDRELSEREKGIRDLETRLRDDLKEMVDANQQRFDAIQDKARDRFRVLSLQLLAEQQVRAHNIETAIKTLKSAVEIDPDDHASNYLLGYLYTSRQQIDLALEHLERALQSDPHFAPGIAAYGLALRRRGDRLKGKDAATITERNRYWAQAEDKLLAALQMDGSLTDADNESYYGTLGGLYRRQGRYADALDAYEQAYKVTPDSSYPVINLAALYKHQGHDERAQHFFELVVEKADLTLDDDPRDVWTRCDRAQAVLVLGRKDEALQEMRTVIGQKPGPGVLETVRSGLLFLREAPSPIEGLDALSALIDAELEVRRTQELELAQIADNDAGEGDEPSEERA